MAKKITETVVDGIKVIIEGEITDFNINLYNQQLAIALMKQLGPEQCKGLVDLLKAESNEKVN